MKQKHRVIFVRLIVIILIIMFLLSMVEIGLLIK